jgi:sugar phosphate isomerase/epimerase
MRFRHPDGTVVHLGYGSNVHPAETVDGIVHQLATFAVGVRERLGWDRLGVGLWLSARAARALATDGTELARVQDVLTRHRLEIVTVNAFPFKGFHDPVVKQAVYHPDWSERSRLDFTLDCAQVLARLLPADAARGSISTLPFGWREPWTADQAALAAEQLRLLADGLAKLQADTGREVRVGIEPEPGCVLERIAEALVRMSELDHDRIGLCLDTCHLATGFEDGADALNALAAAGIPVVKTQVSAALHAQDPTDAPTRAALARYTEDRFLHQVRQSVENGVIGRDDLPEALAPQRGLSGPAPWRVHFHVPVHADPDPPLISTREHLIETMTALLGQAVAGTDHLEVETYTWAVLPPGRRPRDDRGLVAGIAAELHWTADLLVQLGLEPIGGAR